MAERICQPAEVPQKKWCFKISIRGSVQKFIDLFSIDSCQRMKESPVHRKRGSEFDCGSRRIAPLLDVAVENTWNTRIQNREIAMTIPSTQMIIAKHLQDHAHMKYVRMSIWFTLFREDENTLWCIFVCYFARYVTFWRKDRVEQKNLAGCLKTHARNDNSVFALLGMAREWQLLSTFIFLCFFLSTFIFLSFLFHFSFIFIFL